MVVPSAQKTSSTGGSSPIRGRAVVSCSSFGSCTSTSRRPTETTRSQASSASSSSQQVSADESGGAGEQSGTHRASLGGHDSAHGRADPPRHPHARLVPGAMEEFRAEGREGDDPQHDRLGPRTVRRDVGERGGLRGVRPGDARRGAHPARGRSCCQTNWWWVEGEEYVGRISLRHQLTPHCVDFGGHIGYDVRRSQRRKGHATAMLAAVLTEAHRRGIESGTADLQRRQPGVAEGDRGQRGSPRGPERRTSCATGCRPLAPDSDDPAVRGRMGDRRTVPDLESSQCPQPPPRPSRAGPTPRSSGTSASSPTSTTASRRWPTGCCS